MDMTNRKLIIVMFRKWSIIFHVSNSFMLSAKEQLFSVLRTHHLIFTKPYGIMRHDYP